MRTVQYLVVLLLTACGLAVHYGVNAGEVAGASNGEQSAVQEINARLVDRFMEQITGREQQSAEQVFKNIQFLKGVPARQMLVIMNAGYSRALGVACMHCHVEEDFSSDEKRPKRAAREMQIMHRMVNEHLAKVQNLQSRSQNRAINCSTCHRGRVDPMAGGG